VIRVFKLCLNISVSYFRYFTTLIITVDPVCGSVPGFKVQMSQRQGSALHSRLTFKAVNTALLFVASCCSSSNSSNINSTVKAITPFSPELQVNRWTCRWTCFRTHCSRFSCQTAMQNSD